MPFKSNKQKRYMHANLSKIAEKWAKEYAEGGFVPSQNQTAGIKMSPYLPGESTESSARRSAWEEEQRFLRQKMKMDADFYKALENMKPKKRNILKDILSASGDAASQLLESIESDIRGETDYAREGLERMVALPGAIGEKKVDFYKKIFSKIFASSVDSEKFSEKDYKQFINKKESSDKEYKERVKYNKKARDAWEVLYPGQEIPDSLLQSHYQKGGMLKGPSHDKGGIPGRVKGSDQPLEFEGGEIVINKTVNNAADKHGEDLLALNKNPDEFEIVRTTDARKRQNRIG